MEETERKKLADDCILVGQKDFNIYMRSVNTLFLAKNLKEISVKARGKNMNKAIDVSLASTRFLSEQSVAIKEVKLESEEFQDKEGKTRNGSSIEIVLTKK